MAAVQAPGTRPHRRGRETPAQDGPSGEGSRERARERKEEARRQRPPAVVSPFPPYRVPLELASPTPPTGPHKPASASTEHAKERRPPGAMTPAPREAAAGPGRRPPVPPESAHLSGRRSEALHRGDVALHLGLAAPHRAADLAPGRERPALRPAAVTVSGNKRLKARDAAPSRAEERTARMRIASALCAAPTTAALRLCPALGSAHGPTELPLSFGCQSVGSGQRGKEVFVAAQGTRTSN